MNGWGLKLDLEARAAMRKKAADVSVAPLPLLPLIALPWSHGCHIKEDQPSSQRRASLRGVHAALTGMYGASGCEECHCAAVPASRVYDGGEGCKGTCKHGEASSPAQRGYENCSLPQAKASVSSPRCPAPHGPTPDIAMSSSLWRVDGISEKGHTPASLEAAQRCAIYSKVRRVPSNNEVITCASLCIAFPSYVVARQKASLSRTDNF